MARTSVRDKFVEAALKCFHEKGFKGTSIEDIAERAGAFEGSFYNHFESKEALAIAVVTVYGENTVSLLPLEGPPSAYRRLKNHFELHAADQKSVDYRNGCLMGNFSIDISQVGEPLRLALDEAFQRWFAAIATVIRQAQAEGNIDASQNPEQLARFLVNSWEGATNYSKVVRSHLPLEDFFALAFSHEANSRNDASS
jgi:TetR/AcrR family transcriptional regulator, transcriptional repressor for nem operon